jgi:hypothetical protein
VHNTVFTDSVSGCATALTTPASKDVVGRRRQILRIDRVDGAYDGSNWQQLKTTVRVSVDVVES